MIFFLNFNSNRQKDTHFIKPFIPDLADIMSPITLTKKYFWSSENNIQTMTIINRPCVAEAVQQTAS